MELTEGQMAELLAVASDRGVSGPVALRARMVLWRGEGRPRVEVAELAGVSLPTVDRWVGRFLDDGVAGFCEKKRGKPRAQVPSGARDRVIVVTKAGPPGDTGLSHWSARTLSAYLKRVEGLVLSWHYIAKVWRAEGLKPHRTGSFKISRDPAFADKVCDVVGLYLDPPGGAVVLSVDEKTQIQALDRTQPLLPIDFDKTEKRTHDYVRHGVTNLIASLNVGTGKVLGKCVPSRNGAAFLAFMKKAVKPHRGKEIHVIMDNLSTHTTPDVRAWLADNPNIHFHFTPTGSSWLNQIETWFGIATRQSIRRGTFTSVTDLIKRINDYIKTWNATAEPFTWTATAEEILAKVQLVQTNIKKLVDNNTQ